MRDTVVDAEVIRDAVEMACRAPSLHNSQPWRWVVEDNAVHLYLDKDRVLYSTDRGGREALIACGAVLDHFRVAMAAVGWTANVDRFPNPNNRLHLASIDFSPLDFVTEGHRRRAEAILQRRTDRLPYAEPPGWDTVEVQLHRAVTGDAVRFDVIADELRPELAEASRLTESLRLYDSSYHSELYWWTGHFEVSEGVPRSALVSAAESDRVEIARNFPVTTDTDRRSQYGQDQSKVAVLSTYDSEQASVFRCGEALSAVLLDATMAGLATCTLSHITELRSSRNLVATLIDQPSVEPQLLVRIGLAPMTDEPPPPTPRRPVDEVLQIRSKGQ